MGLRYMFLADGRSHCFTSRFSPALGSSIGGWGAILGFLHGLFLLVAALPLMPYVHPRMASSYDSPVARPQLEPPGFLGVYYGAGTPAALLGAQVLYGAILGGLPQLAVGTG